jgi:hypothetical protein
MNDPEKELERIRKLYDSSLDETRYDNVGALSRYFIWADKMRHDFENLISNKGDLDDFTFIEYSHIYMSYWYGALYVLIEGWHDLGLWEYCFGCSISFSLSLTLILRIPLKLLDGISTDYLVRTHL